MAVKAILFDLDNTLIDRNRSLQKYAELFVKSFSHNLGKIEVDGVFSLMVEADYEGYVTRDEFFAKLIEVLPWVQSPNIDEINTHCFSNFAQCSELFTGVHDTLAILHAKEIVLGIVTNGREKQNEKIDVIGVRSLMESVVVSGIVNVKKPDKGIFNIALSELHVDASQTWFVGDHSINDIVGASSVGMTTVWLRHGRIWDNEHPGPDFQINQFSELLNLVEGVLV